MKICSYPVEIVPLKVSKECQRVTRKRRIKISKETDRGDRDCDSLTEYRNILRPLCYISDRYFVQFFAFSRNQQQLCRPKNFYRYPLIFLFSLYFKLGSSTRVFGIQAQFIFKFRTYLSRD